MGLGPHWRRVDARRGAISLLIEWGSLAVVIALTIKLRSIPFYLLAVAVVGAIQHRLAALGHEAAHGTLFPNRFWNDAVADALCFFPVLATVRHYRRWHLAHHAAPNDPERDPDLLNLGPWLLRDRFPMRPRRMAWLVFGKCASAPVSFVRFALSYLCLNSFGMGRGLPPVVPTRQRYSPRVESLARVAYYAAVGLALWGLGPEARFWFVALWLVPIATSFMYYLMLRDTFQHTNADAGRYTNTRVFRVHPVVRWAVFPYGQDLHLPHHTASKVPHYRLEALHRHLLESRASYGEAAVECRGVLRNRTGEPTISDVLMKGV